MRILLVQAFTALDLELVYPIGLSYLAAHLPERHHVEIFDVNLHREAADPYAVLAQKVREFAPDVVGISLRNIKVATPGVHSDDFEPQQRTVLTPDKMFCICAQLKSAPTASATT